MYKKDLLIVFLVLIIIIESIFLLLTPFAKANLGIPENFNKKLDLDEIYIYNVTSFNTTKPLEWASLN
ncbi:MAG: hypothetical protein ACFFA6_07405, partial [Promethearchaeota archaeon]